MAMAPTGKKMTNARAARVPWAMSIFFSRDTLLEVSGVKPEFAFEFEFSSQ